MDEMSECEFVLTAKIEELEEDVREYKDVIDALKQKLDVIECLCEDFKAEKEALKKFIKSIK